MAISNGCLVLVGENYLPSDKRGVKAALGIVERINNIRGNYFCKVRVVYPKSICGGNLIEVARRELFCVRQDAEPLTEDVLIDIVHSMSMQLEKTLRELDSYKRREPDRLDE